MSDKIKVNIGCGPDIKDGWVNIDRYDHASVTKMDILEGIKLPSYSADIVLCNHVLEHIPFAKEKQVWDDIHRITKYKGEIWVIVPDFKWVCRQIVDSDDNWEDFYKITNDVTDPAYGFGNGPGHERLHGELITHVFGHQSNSGQFHYNGYTDGKMEGLACYYNMMILKKTHSFHKSVRNLIYTFRKDT